MGQKYAELRRIDHSLNNFKLSIQNNLKGLGLSDPEDMGQVFQFLYKRVFNATISKKPKLDEELKALLTPLFENMWINEAYVQTSLNKSLTNSMNYHHYFYLVYISFYYSLFTSISIVLRIFEPKTQKNSHAKKINRFNLKIVKTKFLRECYFKPFLLITSNNELKNLDITYPKDICNETVKNCAKLIKDYSSLCEQCTISGDPVINEDIHTLKIAMSLVKYCIENDNNSDGVSYIHYFMSRRHFLHYNASFVYDSDEDYYKDNLLKNIKRSMIYILNITNFLTESIFVRVSNLENFQEIYYDFDNCLFEGIGTVFDENDYFAQFQNLTLRSLCLENPE